MTDELIRFDTAQSTVFEVNEQTRTIKGLVLPYGVIGDNGKGKYTFARGTVTWPADLSRVKLLIGHDFGQAVGHATDLEDTDAGVVGTFKVARGPEGDRALSMAEDKVWDGLSAGIGRAAKFKAGRDGVFAAITADIAETSLTPLPAFDDARVTSVAASAVPTKEEAMPENEPTGNEPVSFSKADGDALMAQVQTLSEEIASLKDIKIPVGPGAQQFQVTEEPIYRFAGTESAPSGFDFAADMLAAAKDGDAAAMERLRKFTAENLGPQFVTTGNVDELNQPKYRPDMFVGQAPVPASPLYDTFYKGGLADVTPFFWTKLDRSTTTVAVHDHTEGTEPAADNLVTAAGTTVTPTAVSGKVHITREVADQGGNPQVSALVWSEFQRSLAIALETKTAALISAAMGSVTALATITTGTTGLAAGTAVEAGLVDLQFVADGFRFTRAFGHIDLYKALAGATLTTTGEKVYPIINPSNRDGQSGDKFAYLDIAGYRMYPAASLGTTGGTKNSLVADPNAVHVWNSGLQRLDKLQEKVEGWDLGCFAYFAGVVYDLTGLRKITYTP